MLALTKVSASLAYLEERLRSHNAGKVPDFRPKSVEILDRPLAQALVVGKMDAMLLLD